MHKEISQNKSLICFLNSFNLMSNKQVDAIKNFQTNVNALNKIERKRKKEEEINICIERICA